MITYCLHEIEFRDIEQYNKRYSDIFIDNYLGIQLVKENEDGSSLADSDSGPVLFGYGASATIMNIKTQSKLSSTSAKITWGAMNVIALPINSHFNKYYLFKREPMLDLFMLWACVSL